MGWSVGWDHNWYRDIGYGVPAYCDFPGCNKEIDRGLGYICACIHKDENFEDFGCGLFFCEKHSCAAAYACDDCTLSAKAKEHPDWIKHKLTDPSWEQWRQENPDEARRLYNSRFDSLKIIFLA